MLRKVIIKKTYLVVSVFVACFLLQSCGTASIEDQRKQKVSEIEAILDDMVKMSLENPQKVKFIKELLEKKG